MHRQANASFLRLKRRRLPKENPKRTRLHRCCVRWHTESWFTLCLIISLAPIQYDANKEERNPGHAQSPLEISYFAQTSLTPPSLSPFYSPSVLCCIIAERFLLRSACICFGQKIIGCHAHVHFLVPSSSASPFNPALFSSFSCPLTFSPFCCRLPPPRLSEHFHWSPPAQHKELHQVNVNSPEDITLPHPSFQ